MYRLPTLAVSATLLLAGVAATPPMAPQPGMPAPGPVAPPMATLAPAAAPTAAPVTAPTAAATATPTPNPTVLALAKSWFAQLQAGKINRSQLAAGMNLTDDQVKKAAAQLGNLGTPVTFEQQQTASQGGITYVIYLVTFGNATKLDFGFAVNGSGQVAGLRIMPVR